MTNLSGRKQTGFTIVELLIVIVIIAILAAITIAAYNGIQQRTRDTARQSDTRTITKALELYYIDNGQYPSSSGSTTINASWSTTTDTSWQNLANQLVPQYISSMPSDPSNSYGTSPVGNNKNYGYAYFANVNATYCGAQVRHLYILVVKLEGATQQTSSSGDCSSGTDGPGPYLYNSTYRIIKN